MEPSVFEVTPVYVLVISILVLWVGQVLTERVRFLEANNIPIAVTGGLLCSLLVVGIRKAFDIEIVFDMELRNILLLVFFSTIGLTARLNRLVAGGRPLALLLLVSLVFLVLQDATGVGLALLFDAHPGYGLFAGSISFAGGHGTAIAWGQTAAEAGLGGGATLGIAFATFGLIVGGLIGGPIAGRLVRRNDLHPEPEQPEPSEDVPASQADRPVEQGDIFLSLLRLGLCIGLGEAVNELFFDRGVLLPGFLTAMLVGIVIVNVNAAGKLGKHLNPQTIDVTGSVSLQLFLAMSLMSMDLTSLGAAATPIVIALFAQTLMITLFGVFIVFRLLGRDYDAAVITGGFVGLGMGATPVAIANMQVITSKYGASAKAFLIVPLVGAFFIDLLNALVIKLFLALPMMSQPMGG